MGYVPASNYRSTPPPQPTHSPPIPQYQAPLENTDGLHFKPEHHVPVHQQAKSLNFGATYPPPSEGYHEPSIKFVAGAVSRGLPPLPPHSPVTYPPPNYSTMHPPTQAYHAPKQAKALYFRSPAQSYLPPAKSYQSPKPAFPGYIPPSQLALGPIHKGTPKPSYAPPSKDYLPPHPSTPQPHHMSTTSY